MVGGASGVSRVAHGSYLLALRNLSPCNDTCGNAVSLQMDVSSHGTV